MATSERRLRMSVTRAMGRARSQAGGHMTRHTWRITPIVGLVLASTLAATAASAVDIRGTFKYQDTRGPMPIRRCYVEIWFHGTGFFDTWNPIAARTTDSSGRIS